MNDKAVRDGVAYALQGVRSLEAKVATRSTVPRNKQRRRLNTVSGSSRF